MAKKAKPTVKVTKGPEGSGCQIIKADFNKVKVTTGPKLDEDEAPDAEVGAESEETNPNPPVEMPAVNFGFQKEDGSWEVKKLMPFRYLIAGEMFRTKEKYPKAMAWCDDMPKEEPGCSEDLAMDIQGLFEFYTTKLLIQDPYIALRGSTQTAFLLSSMVSCISVYSFLDHAGNIETRAVGAVTPWITGNKELVEKMNDGMYKALEKAATEMKKAPGVNPIILTP